jgi:hypothetical protein
MASKKTGRKRRPSGSRRRRVVVIGPPEEADPDEAVAFIAELLLADLARIARRHRLDLLTHLLSMAHLEAEEHVRLRSRRKLS